MSTLSIKKYKTAVLVHVSQLACLVFSIFHCLQIHFHASSDWSKTIFTPPPPLLDLPLMVFFYIIKATKDELPLFIKEIKHLLGMLQDMKKAKKSFAMSAIIYGAFHLQIT